MDNYNIKVREIIENWVEIGNQLGVDAHTLLSAHIPNIYNFFQEPENSVISMYLLEVAYLDAYKMYSHKQKECLNNDLDENVFGFLIDIESLDDLVELIYNDPIFFEKILYASFEFANLSYLGKSLIMKSLTEDENYHLQDLFPVHNQDIATYDTPIGIETIIKYIYDKNEYQHNIMGIEFKGGIIANVLGYIENLIKLDYENAISLILDIGKIDYATSKYLLKEISLSKQATAEDKNLLIDHIDLYENYKTADIIAKLFNDQDFLKDAIWNLADAYVYNESFGLELTPELIESKEATEVAKKLVLSNI